jgi:DNA-binding transcriptional regulator GbsR (MarR family)
MEETEDPTHAFVEQVGAFFEQSGLPATSGRILGHLLVCATPVQSSSELARALHTTSGSISTNTRLLVQSGLIERAPIRGRRGIFFRIAPGVWDSLLDLQVRRTRQFREILDSGVRLLRDEPPPRGQRVKEARDYYALMEAELPAMMRRHTTSRGKE